MNLIERFAMELWSSRKKIPRPRAQRDRDGTGVYMTTVTHRGSALQSASVEASRQR